MKILILQDDFPPRSYGGAGVVAFNMAEGFKDMGHDVFVISIVKDRKEEGESGYKGFKVYNIYSRYHERWRAYLSLYNPMTVKKVKNIIEEISPDVVFANNIHFDISYHSLKLAKKSGAKVFLTAHDVMLFHYGKLVECVNSKDLSCPNKFNYKVSSWQQIKKYRKRYNPFRNIIIKHYLKYVDRIFTVSDALKDTLNQNGIGNIETIHNGVNVSEWVVSEEAINKFKKKYNLQNKKIVLFGGRLSGLKGGEKVLEAMEFVSKEISNSVLLVIGKEDEYAKRMKVIASTKKVDIVFTGWLFGNDLKTAYLSSDLVTVLSLCFDSFPTINFEAMACKKPVVGTCFGGTPEVVQNGITGYIVNPYDIKSSAEKILILLKNSKKAEEFGKAGYERVKTNFNSKDKLNKYIAMYETFLEKEE